MGAHDGRNTHDVQPDEGLQRVRTFLDEIEDAQLSRPFPG